MSEQQYDIVDEKDLTDDYIHVQCRVKQRNEQASAQEQKRKGRKAGSLFCFVNRLEGLYSVIILLFVSLFAVTVPLIVVVVSIGRMLQSYAATLYWPPQAIKTTCSDQSSGDNCYSCRKESSIGLRYPVSLSAADSRRSGLPSAASQDHPATPTSSLLFFRRTLRLWSLNDFTSRGHAQSSELVLHSFIFLIATPHPILPRKS